MESSWRVVCSIEDDLGRAEANTAFSLVLRQVQSLYVLMSIRIEAPRTDLESYFWLYHRDVPEFRNAVESIHDRLEGATEFIDMSGRNTLRLGVCNRRRGLIGLSGQLEPTRAIGAAFESSVSQEANLGLQLNYAGLLIDQSDLPSLLDTLSQFIQHWELPVPEEG